MEPPLPPSSSSLCVTMKPEYLDVVLETQFEPRTCTVTIRINDITAAQPAVDD